MVNAGGKEKSLLEQVLSYIFVKIGLRAQNFPVPEEKMVLMEHIIENYPNNRVEEMKLAFNLAINGKLNIRPEDVKCYENFSCAYFSSIMNAYISWARERSSELEKISEPAVPVALIGTSKITDEEIDNLARGDAEMQYQRFLRTPSAEMVYGLELNRPILLKDGFLKEGGCNCKYSVIELFRKKAMAGFANLYIKHEKE